MPQSDHSDGEGLDVGNVEHLKHVGTVEPMSPALKTSSNLNYPYYFTNKEVLFIDNLKKKKKLGSIPFDGLFDPHLSIPRNHSSQDTCS